MDNKDEKLWQLATERAKFKGHVITYVVVNIFLWAIWLITTQNDKHTHDYLIPCPAWATIGWGFSLAMKYLRLYHMNTDDQIQKEYDKLKNLK